MTSLTYPQGVMADTTFDFADRPKAMTLTEGVTTTNITTTTGATYASSGPVVSLPLGNSRTETRAFDRRFQPTSISMSNSLLTWAYTVDKVGNVTLIHQTLPAPINDRTFGYQRHQQFLTSAAGPWTGPLSWTFDRIGNRLTETRGANTDTYSYLTNGASGHEAVLDLVTLGAGGNRDYTFDAGGFLEGVVAGANAIDFTFDEAGLLARVERPAASVGQAFFYDGRSFLAQVGSNPFGLFSDGFESSNFACWSAIVGGTGGGTCPPLPSADKLIPTYSSAGRLFGLTRQIAGSMQKSAIVYFGGRPIANWRKVDSAASTITWLTTDHLGTPVLASSAAGAAVWRGGFEPYGVDYSVPSAESNNIFLRLPGQWHDPLWANASLGADVNYNLYRWYELAIGRYSAREPFRQMATSSDFAYVQANPVGGRDPLGLFRIAETCDCTPDVDPKFPGFNLSGTIKRACGYLNSPHCGDVLRQAGYLDCYKDRCKEPYGEGPMISCSMLTENCGWTTPSGDIVLYRGNAGCPRQSPPGSSTPPGPRDYSQTLFHEIGHVCGVPGKADEREWWFAIQTTCTGWPVR